MTLKNITKSHIGLTWLLLNIALSYIVSLITMFYWQFTYLTKSNINWTPIEDLSGVLISLPFAWFFSLLFPYCWINLIGLAIARYKKDIRYLLISLPGTIIFGIYWPYLFVAMMGI